MAATEAAS